MAELVLSLFPGIGMLDAAFEEAGFCVVRGPDILWGGDVRRFHPPAGRFDGVIGGPPCQVFSTANRLAKSRKQIAAHGNLVPEYERCVKEAAPAWFIMENVPGAPVPAVEGYGVNSCLLNNRQLGEVQNRIRRWSLGWRGERRVLRIETTALESSDKVPCVSTAQWEPGPNGRRRQCGCKSTRHFELFKKWQGLPDSFDLPPFRVADKVRAVCNGVPMAMGRAIAAAVRRALEEGRS